MLRRLANDMDVIMRDASRLASCLISGRMLDARRWPCP